MENILLLECDCFPDIKESVNEAVMYLILLGPSDKLVCP